MNKQLDLGCGNNPKGEAGYEVYGVDIAPVDLPSVRMADLAIEPIPFADNEFELVTAYDFIEHIPALVYIWDDVLKKNVRRNSVIELFNEIYRVLKPGGRFVCMVPEFPLVGSVQDPTHVSFWNTESVQYFGGTMVDLCRFYGLKQGFTGAACYRDSSFPIHIFYRMFKP